MHEKSYNICEITSKQLWDSFVTSQQNHTFLHSWDWGEFNTALGDKVWRLGVLYSGHKNDPNIKRVIIGSCQVIKVHARRGNFLFVPHGPVGDVKALPTLVKKLQELARQEKVSFIRISPILNDTEENRKLFSDLGFRRAPIHMHAETTWSLDLSPSEDELLANMRKTTRNLIRRAIKEGVDVKMGDSEADVELFYQLYQETVKKHHFTPFSLTYLQEQVRILPETKVLTAYHQGQPLASAIIVFYGNSAFYHHGASIPSKIPAAYLLQWEAIREAKRRGHKLYNFWGVVKEDALSNHPWHGITLFKKGFGGFQTDSLHAQDFITDWRYWIDWLIETFRRRKRNL